MKTPKETAHELLDEFKQIKSVTYENNEPTKEEKLTDNMAYLSICYHVQLMIIECKRHNSERESFWELVLFELKRF